MAIINFDFPRTPCLTGFGNVTMYNWKMLQWSRPPLLVIPESRRKHWRNPFAQWKNHPQTKAETTHTLKRLNFWCWGGYYLEEISDFFRQLLSNLRQIGAPALNCWRKGRSSQGPPGWPCLPELLTNGQGNALACCANLYVTYCWPWWDVVRWLIWKRQFRNCSNRHINKIIVWWAEFISLLD